VWGLGENMWDARSICEDGYEHEWVVGGEWNEWERDYVWRLGLVCEARD
jgi:hypothetical protein